MQDMQGSVWMVAANKQQLAHDPQWGTRGTPLCWVLASFQKSWQSTTSPEFGEDIARAEDLRLQMKCC